MNLRILKKLSRRAAPLLARLGDTRTQFAAERHENYTGLSILARKHFDRTRSPHGDVWDEHERKHPARDGNGWIRMTPPYNPWPGTIMVGGVVGYYEPEWEEEPAWEALRDIIWRAYTNWGDEPPTVTRCLRTPRDVFRAAHDLIRDLAEDHPTHD